MRRTLKDFKNNTQGVFWVTSIAIVIMVTSLIVWGVVMLVATNFVTAFSGLTNVHASTVYLGNTEIIMGSAVLVVIEVGTAIWWITSAFKQENQEFPDYMVN